MNTFLKSMIKGVLGVGTLFIVGKVCYEVGRNVGDLERQLEDHKAADLLNKSCDTENMVLERDEEPKVRHFEKIDAAEPNETTPKEVPSGFLAKLRNAKMFLAAKRTFDKRDRPKGILGSLLTNPDGAKIEAIVKDGGVQISVKPRAA